MFLNYLGLFVSLGAAFIPWIPFYNRHYKQIWRHTMGGFRTYLRMYQTDADLSRSLFMGSAMALTPERPIHSVPSPSVHSTFTGGNNAPDRPAQGQQRRSDNPGSNDALGTPVERTSNSRSNRAQNIICVITQKWFGYYDAVSSYITDLTTTATTTMEYDRLRWSVVVGSVLCAT